MQGLTINITLDSHATPQLIQFLREAQAEETHILRQMQQQLSHVQHAQGALVQQLTRIEEKIMANQDLLNQVKAKVEAGTTVQQSAITLLTQLAQIIRDAADDPAEITAIADRLDAQNAALAAAVSANTPQAPTP